MNNHDVVREEDLQRDNLTTDAVGISEEATGNAGTGGHNFITGEEAHTQAGATGLAAGAIIGGAIGTLAAGPLGAAVGGTIGSLAGGIAGDASEAAVEDEVNQSSTSNLTTGISADRDPTLSDDALTAQMDDRLNEAPLSGNATTGTNPITRQSSERQKSDDPIV